MQELLFPKSLLGRLPSFKALSTVHRGRIYEEWSMHVLQNCLSMSLQRVGGRADGGIDLQGWWWLPVDETTAKDPYRMKRVRVLAQCKAEKRKIGPKYVREMEGVLHRFAASDSDLGPTNSLETSPPETQVSPTVGLFISASSFSKMTLLRAHSSPLPLALLHLPCPTPEQYECMVEEEAADEISDCIGSMVFNAALGGSSGVLRGDFEPRWEYSSMPESVGRPALWWKGRRMQSWVPTEGKARGVEIHS